MTAAFVAQCAARVRRTDWMGCFQGVVPPGIAAPLDMGEPRLRRLRDHPRWRYMLQPTRTARFWFRELAFLSLLSAIALRSSALNGTALPVTLRDLARQSGLSIATAQQVVEAAATTGDLFKQRAKADGRLLILDLAPHIVAELDERHRQYLDMIAEFTGRSNPAPALPPPAWRELCRLMLRAALPTKLSPSRSRAGDARRTFLYLLFDLLLDGPQEARRFTAEAATRMQVTAATVRNTLARARAEGWLEAGPWLVPTAMARERFGFALATLEARWQALLDAAEALVADPSLAFHLNVEANDEDLAATGGMISPLADCSSCATR